MRRRVPDDQGRPTVGELQSKKIAGTGTARQRVESEIDAVAPRVDPVHKLFMAIRRIDPDVLWSVVTDYLDDLDRAAAALLEQPPE